jgi:hypothetical protein
MIRFYCFAEDPGNSASDLEKLRLLPSDAPVVICCDAARSAWRADAIVVFAMWRGLCARRDRGVPEFAGSEAAQRRTA